jgi:hypothetical protein
VSQVFSGVGTKSFAIKPPPITPTLSWRWSFVATLGPGPLESWTTSAKTPIAPA